MAPLLPPHTTISYKKIENQDIYFDLYSPRTDFPAADGIATIPAIVHFHGGGLVVGTRASWFPLWLHERAVVSGYAFLSMDYQLIPPGTGHDIISDISDFFSFITKSTTIFTTSVGPSGNIVKYRIDEKAISIAGSSAGGLCAYLAATILRQKPKVLLSMYGMGGDFMTPFYLEPKNKPFIPGVELVDPKDYKEFLFPFSLPITTGSELEYLPDTNSTSGLPATPRMYLTPLFRQLAVFLDYYTGIHEPSLSEALWNRRQELASLGSQAQPEGWSTPLIPEQHRVLFPQLSVTADWPRVMMIHGNQDYLVPHAESEHMRDILEAAGVNVILKVVEGRGHGFDLEPGAETEFGSLFDEASKFLMV